MDHQQLWAPWRLGYVQGKEPADREDSGQPAWLPESDPACFLCRDVAESRDRHNLLLHRGKHTLTVLNRFPYNNGHLLIAPRRHVARLDRLTDDEHLESMQVAAWLTTVLAQAINADGFNLGLNLGRVAGAGLPGHLHWHIVPRWNGDTNFMPVLAGIKVIPQSLDALWELLSSALATVDAPRDRHA
ncbi:MAG: HIT domain-containing protein [Pirellulales bacterium]